MDFLDDAAEPFPTVDDQAAAVLMLADTAGIERFALVGASYGGSVGLSLAAMAPERVSRLDLLCASAGVHPMTQGLRAIQREILKLAIEAGQGARGVDIARRLAMTTYRTPEEFARRFGPEGEPGGVEAYLSARGADYARAVTPERFLSRLASMEAANPDLSAITCPVNLLAFTSDRLVPLEEVEATRAALTGCDSRLVVHDSPYGHDAFLKEAARVNAFLEGRHD
jgi:homoserine O-acetyltransferase